MSIISYFRLANYWRPMEMDKANHLFKPNSTFENVLSLYCFDKELRALIFSAIQSIEIALRTKVIHHCSLVHGPFWFMNDGLMKSTKQHEENLSNLSKELNLCGKFNGGMRNSQFCFLKAQIIIQSVTKNPVFVTL